MNGESVTQSNAVARLYLDLVKKCLTRYGFERQTFEPLRIKGGLRGAVFRVFAGR